MSDLVPTEDIERIVGITRNGTAHYGRAVSSEQTVYILHSKECLDSGVDLRDCVFSEALDRGIETQSWDGFEDIPVALGVWHRRLIPVPVGEENSQPTTALMREFLVALARRFPFGVAIMACALVAMWVVTLCIVARAS